MQVKQLILLSISLIDIARTSRDGEVERIEKTERIPGAGHVPLMVDDSSSSNIDNNAVPTGITGTPTVVEYRFGADDNNTNINDNTIINASSYQLHLHQSLIIVMIMIILCQLFSS